MDFKGYFNIEIQTLFNKRIDPWNYVIEGLKKGNCASEDIYDTINEKYENAEQTEVYWERYITVDNMSTKLDSDDFDEHYVHFVADCHFDMERFARENNLVEKSQDLEM